MDVSASVQNKYLLRGKSIEDGAWCLGFIYIDERNGKYWILTSKNTNATMHMDEVLPETIGRSTGLRDKSGAMIFEGDIVMVNYGMGKVVYSETQGMFIIVWVSDKEANTESLAYEPDSFKCGRVREDLKILGNLWDNKVLLR